MDVDQFLYEVSTGVHKFKPLDILITRKHRDDVQEKDIESDIASIINKYGTKLPLYHNKIIVDGKAIDGPFPDITISTTSWQLSELDRRLLLLSKLIQFNLHHYVKNHPNVDGVKALLRDKVKVTRDKWENDGQYYSQLIVTFNEFNIVRKLVEPHQFDQIRNGFWRPYRLLDLQVGHVWYDVKKVLKYNKMYLSS